MKEIFLVVLFATVIFVPLGLLGRQDVKEEEQRAKQEVQAIFDSCTSGTTSVKDCHDTEEAAEWLADYSEKIEVTSTETSEDGRVRIVFQKK